jgi:PAS domain S-box-containing protein
MSDADKSPDDLRREIDSLKQELAAERDARKCAEAKMNEQLRLFRSVLDGVPMLVYVKDDKNNIVYVNEPAAAARGLPCEEIEGKSTYEIYPDDAAHYYEDDLSVIRSGQAKVGIVEQVMSHSGEKRWVSTSKFPWHDADKNIIGVLVTASDITDIVRQQDQRDSLMSAVAKALEQQRRILFASLQRTAGLS